jgi:hypothetical protein
MLSWIKQQQKNNNNQNKNKKNNNKKWPDDLVYVHDTTKCDLDFWAADSTPQVSIWIKLFCNSWNNERDINRTDQKDTQTDGRTYTKPPKV